MKRCSGHSQAEGRPKHALRTDQSDLYAGVAIGLRNERNEAVEREVHVPDLFTASTKHVAQAQTDELALRKEAFTLAPR